MVTYGFSPTPGVLDPAVELQTREPQHSLSNLPSAAVAGLVIRIARPEVGRGTFQAKGIACKMPKRRANVGAVR